MYQNWRQGFMAFLTDTEAAVGSEHALLLTLIALGIFGMLTFFGKTVSDKLYQSSIALLPF